MLKSKQPSRSGSSLETVEPHPYKGAKNFFLKFKRNSSRISLLQVSVSNIARENSLREGKVLESSNY